MPENIRIMTQTHKDKLQGTRDLMAALGRMPPKPHEDMKISKTSVKKVKSPKPKKKSD
jgi:hypothetical protein